MPLVDFYKWNKRMWDKVYSIMDIEAMPEFSPRLVRGFYYFSYEITPMIMNILSFIGLLFIMKGIVDSQGIEGLAVLFMAIYIMSKKWGGQEESRNETKEYLAKKNSENTENAKKQKKI